MTKSFQVYCMQWWLYIALDYAEHGVFDLSVIELERLLAFGWK